MNIGIVRQYSVFLPNKPGALSEFVKLFYDNGLNIIGIASEVRDDSGIIRVAVENDDRICHVLTKAGFTTVETPLLSIELSDRPGQLYRLSTALSGAGINITTVYGTTLCGKSSRVLIAVNDPQKAVDALKDFEDIPSGT